MNSSASHREVPCAPSVELTPWLLPEGTCVHVRPLSPSDRELELQFLESLSERTKYLRLMTPLRYVSRELLKLLLDVNDKDRAALVATIQVHGREEFIAVARYAVTKDPTTAELAITVTDAWQYKGVATRLLGRLILHARSQGITKLTGLVLPENAGMLCLARKFGADVHFDTDQRLMCISIDTSNLERTSGGMHLQ